MKRWFSMRGPRPRTFDEIVAVLVGGGAWREVSAARGLSTPQSILSTEVSVNEDRDGTGEWRVEYFDNDGGCYVTIFAGPEAAQRARAYFQALKGKSLKTIRAHATH